MATRRNRIDIGCSPVIPWSGAGYFAGEPAGPLPDDPDGLARKVNVPSRVRVTAFERSTMICVGSTISAADGTWRINGVDPAMPCVVLGHDDFALQNAAVQDWVMPMPYSVTPPLTLDGYILNSAPGVSSTWVIRGKYAVGDVEFELISGALPTGWALSASGAICTITGTASTPGDYDFVLQGTDEDGNVDEQAYSFSVIDGALIYRLVITANNGNASFATVVELELRASIGGANQSAAATVSASSEVNSSNRASFVNDGDITSKWTPSARPTVVAPQWVQLAFQDLVEVNEIAILGAITGQLDMAPKDFTLERSQDGTTWDVVGTFTNVTGWAVGVYKTFSI